jgi:hypothetical protein
LNGIGSFLSISPVTASGPFEEEVVEADAPFDAA